MYAMWHVPHMPQERIGSALETHQENPLPLVDVFILPS